MFFLYTYGMVNLAAFVESIAGNPSFRPTFKYFHWIFAVCGAFACAGTAFLIDPFSAVLAVFLVSSFYFYLRRKVLKVRFGDARWGFVYTRLRDNLLKLARQPVHPKNWRPTLLVFAGDPDDRLTISMYALWIGEERGLITFARVLVGDIVELAHLRDAAVSQLNNFLRENNFDALSSVVVSKNLDEGLSALIQGHAVGPLKPNVVVMGWSSDPERADSFIHHLNSAILLDMSLILVWDKGLPKDVIKKRIDIWWRGRANGSLMVLLAHLLISNWEWSRGKIRIIRLIDDEAGRKPAREALTNLVAAARVNAEVEILVSESSFVEVLYRHSKDATVVFLGFAMPKEEDAEKFHQYFESILSELPTTLLVCSSGDADFLE